MTALFVDESEDRRWMWRALRLAVLGRETAPNPMVGCVLLNSDGVKVGEGYHVRPGEGHAEANALAMAGGRARGGTAYVTLEPCSHFGRTPPCANALVAAGLARVVVAMTDPDERVSGKGIALLSDAGVHVDAGVCEAAARRLNEAYIKHRTTGMPFVTVKTAMTMDGRIATVTGDSRWITSPVTRLWVHRQLRARSQGILVGVGTVLADDPSLTTRLPHRPAARSPIRIVVDTRLRTPLDARVVRLAAGDGKTVIAHASQDEARMKDFERRGVKLLREDRAAGADRVDLRWLLRTLGTEWPLIRVLVEGGGKINAALLEAGLVDRYVVVMGAQIVGGNVAPGPVGGAGLALRMSEAIRTAKREVRRSGPDLVLSSEILQVV